MYAPLGSEIIPEDDSLIRKLKCAVHDPEVRGPKPVMVKLRVGIVPLSPRLCPLRLEPKIHHAICVDTTAQRFAADYK